MPACLSFDVEKHESAQSLSPMLPQQVKL